jgi:hypothetical protein
MPFEQQPILQTADQEGNPSTNGLPASLAVAIAQTAGTGPLLGTTNVDLGSAAWNGVVPFSDLQINSAGTGNELTAQVVSLTNVLSENLLRNGDFNSPNSGAAPDDWATWTTGGGWANHENNAGITLDGSYYMVVGGNQDQGGGVHQTVPAAAGATYQLSVQSGADTWWRPYGEMRVFFLDAADTQVGYQFRPTLNPPDYGGLYDIPHPWSNYTMTAVAPAGTTTIKVEFMSTGTGSIWYEDAVLTELTSVPALASSTTLPFTVHPAPPPLSQTNYIAGITDSGNGTYLLQFVGTIGVPYYAQTTTNLVPPIVWDAVVGSTNTVTNIDGLWNLTVSNTSQQRFYRSRAINP